MPGSGFNLIEYKSKDGKKYYIEGYVSTTDPDFANDIIDEEGQNATYRELNSADITMDLDHEEWRDPVTGEEYDEKKNKIPVAKVKEKKLDSNGTWVKAELNQAHPGFSNILESIKNGFLHSFSVAYKPVKYFTMDIGDKVYRVIQDLKLANIGMTGNPVNKNATFNIALKAISKKMVEETKIEDLQKQNTELKSELDSVKSELTELKGMDYKKKYEELKAEYDKMVEDNKKEKNGTETKSQTPSDDNTAKENAELKSLYETVESQKKELSDLKSIVEKIRETPATGAEMKSNTTPKEPQEIDFKSLIGGTQ